MMGAIMKGAEVEFRCSDCRGSPCVGATSLLGVVECEEWGRVWMDVVCDGCGPRGVRRVW